MGGGPSNGAADKPLALKGESRVCESKGAHLGDLRCASRLNICCSGEARGYNGGDCILIIGAKAPKGMNDN